MKVFEYTITYKNAIDEVISRYTYAANGDEACANFYSCTYSNGAELISIVRSDGTEEKDIDQTALT